jgi:hypothetical protein
MDIPESQDGLPTQHDPVMEPFDSIFPAPYLGASSWSSASFHHLGGYGLHSTVQSGFDFTGPSSALSHINAIAEIPSAAGSSVFNANINMAGVVDGVAGPQAMGPPKLPRKPKAMTLREQDWQPVKARVIELHIEQGLPLPEVRARIEREMGFEAT